MQLSLVVFRIVAGLVLFISGLGKAVQPYQNFQFAIQAYEIVPAAAEPVLALLLPWIELFCGLFLILGLWLRPSLWVASALFASFCAVLTQAWWRGIDLGSCGCFGNSLQISPTYMLILDGVMLAGSAACLRFPTHTNRLSLDRLFDGKTRPDTDSKLRDS